MTLAVWLSTTVIAFTGHELAYPKATLPPRLPPIAVENLHVELTSGVQVPDTVLPQPEAEQSVDQNIVVPEPQEPTVDPSPSISVPEPLAEVALPNPAIAFAVPIDSPARIVAPAAAQSTAVPGTTAGPSLDASRLVLTAPAPRKITFGIGDGRQPQPMYPSEAIRQGQEGQVVVRFTVGEDGRVAVADVVEPCKWPSLNREAARTIRELWRFGPGKVRVYDVSITFKLDG